MKILAINCGSSSLKFKLFEMPQETVLTEGAVERIGLQDAIFTIKIEGGKQTETEPITTHEAAAKKVIAALLDRGVVSSIDEIKGVGHRITQGGAYFTHSVLIDADVLAKVASLSSLAPLHNPAAVTGIKAFLKVLPSVPQSITCDTCFHQTMPEEAYMYAVPYEWYTKYGVRKYGFHGTSHYFVSRRCAELLKKDIKDTRIITCHIGNGVSLAAIKGGLCIDTSMGLTPLEGIPMGTRSGDIDPTVIEYISEKEGCSAKDVVTALNKKSGYLGVSGYSNDARDLERAMADSTNPERARRCRLALHIQYKKVMDYIGAYYFQLEGLDALVFTAGIGENSEGLRRYVIDHLDFLGVKLDEEANKVHGKEREITTKDSKIRAFVIPTNEELVIARDVVALIEGRTKDLSCYRAEAENA